MKSIIPNYDQDSQNILNNRKAIEALDNYVRSRVKDIDTSSFSPKFGRLVRALNAIPESEKVETREALERNFPQIKGHVELLEHCLEAYKNILSGKSLATEILFPDGSFDLVEKVYTSNPIADHFNEVVAEITRNYIKNSHKPIKILEVGAGTGGTAKFVLPAVKDLDVHYTFTDLSFSFLNKAKRKFSDYPFVNYRILDISSEDNGIKEKYDVIIATNVIHATADLNVSLKNICNLLNENGIFILNEITTIQNFATVVFGLTDGWWLYEDKYRIENSPLVTGVNWRKLIENSGMFFVEKYGDDDQQVMVSTKLPQGERGIKNNDPTSLIRKIISDVMMMDESEIDNDVPFQEYGIDSIISLELMKPLKEVYGYLPATLLFEYPTARALADYLQNNFSDITIKGESTREPEADTSQETLSKIGHTSQQAESPIDRQSATAKTSMGLSDSAKKLVKSVISQVMMMDESEIDDDVPFQEYGIDSIISLELMKPLKEVYGYLPATLLFEYPTVSTLSGYLQENFSSADIGEDVEKTSKAPVTEGEIGDDDIAVIGMACKLPQANNLEDFTNNLMQGRDCTSLIPYDRWDQDGFVREDSPLSGGSYTNRGAFVDDVYSFDCNFFNLPPNEAIKMDPQERLFLQNAVHVVQDAGCRLEDLGGTDTGVYVGVMNSPYCQFTTYEGDTVIPTSLRWSIANRVSYIFDLHGPSMAIDTACSSSLTAIHLACQALKAGDCSQAIIGGVNLILHPKQYEALCALYMLSKSEQCKPFGKGADGFVDGEGIVSIFVKKYKDAVKSGDRIYAIIRGSAINAGGKSNGYTAPNVHAQTDLIRKSLKISGVDENEIGYIEAHGTGTELGDPIEIRGLAAAFSEVKNHKIALGSVKGNIGHLESAAGITGLVKTVLQMQESAFFPSIHAEEENPYINLEATPFYINKDLKQCSEDEVKNACVSSFGAGGANAHVVLSKFLQKSISLPESEFYFITVSSKSLNGLQFQMTALADWLMKNYVSMYSLAYTLNCARDHFKYRRIFVVKSQDELAKLLRTDLTEQPQYSLYSLPQQMCDIANKYMIGEAIDWREMYPIRSLVDAPLYHFDTNYLRVDCMEYTLSADAEIILQHKIEGNCIAPAALTISKMFSLFLEKDKEKSQSIGKKVQGTMLRWLRWLKSITSFDRISEELRDSSIKFTSGDSNDVFFEADFSVDTGDLSNFFRDMTDYRFISHEQIYDFFDDQGYIYGKYMQALQWAKVSQRCAKGFLYAEKNWGYSISPALLDAGLQLALLMFNNMDGNFVPVSLEECHVRPFDTEDAVYCYCVPRDIPNPDYVIECDFYYVNSKSEILAKLIGLKSIKLKKNQQEHRQILHFD